MGHRGERSLISKQRRAVRKYVLDTSFRDRNQAESICTVTYEAVLTYLQQQYPFVFPHVANVTRGEVLLDSRGNGSFQK